MKISSFKKIKVSGTKRKSTCVAEQIIDAISRGDYGVGDKLPSERVIAESMGVSRVPVREGLSALQIVGIVESVVSEGTYVRQSMENTRMKTQALSLLENEESPFEAYAARAVFETAIIGMVIDNAGRKDLDKLEKILSKMEDKVKEKKLREYFQLNKLFHLEIAKATHNSVIVNISEYLLSILEEPLWKEAAEKHFSELEHIKEYIERHYRILLSIKDGDVEAAKSEMENHFADTVDEVKKYL